MTIVQLAAPLMKVVAYAGVVAVTEPGAVGCRGVTVWKPRVHVGPSFEETFFLGTPEGVTDAFVIA